MILPCSQCWRITSAVTFSHLLVAAVRQVNAFQLKWHANICRLARNTNYANVDMYSKKPQQWTESYSRDASMAINLLATFRRLAATEFLQEHVNITSDINAKCQSLSEHVPLTILCWLPVTLMWEVRRRCGRDTTQMYLMTSTATWPADTAKKKLKLTLFLTAVMYLLKNARFTSSLCLQYKLKGPI